ncbi:amidohydrolase family protein [Sediminicoccus sp. KRV36]|uniref:amidohydrolase family protein n=1 Tax=Sediminicoccus sp. KRV36 TaxID=3133721 RepID=UPI00200F0FB8|nr:amidohydrolase family protein [Sediminicoccus rosea]UPY37979.1 amidohydrolase family protein [Sediminicoccus rosea]
MLLIRHATIVTGDAAGTIHHDGAIAIEGNRIAALGPDAEIVARHPGAEMVDAAGRAIFPGFANIHTHLVMTLARGVFEDLSPPHDPPFTGGLSPIPLPPLTPHEQAVMCELGALEAIRSGTTAMLEDASQIENYADRMEATGLRMLLTERAWDRIGTSIGDPAEFVRDAKVGEAGIARIRALHAKWNGAGEGRIRVGVSAWSPDMCSPELLRALRALQQELDTICTIHLNQIWGEVAAIQAHHNMLPTEFLDSIGFIHDRMIGAHCRCMAPMEEKILGKRGAHVAFNSAIAARRGLSPRVCEMAEAGANIGMGTDNMAEDMVEAMRTGLFMERVRRRDGRNPTPEEALRWATRNGYKAMGVPDGGWLAEGNLADLIMIRTDRAHLVPFLRPVSVFLHQGQAADVEDVMVDGRWVMRDGVVLTMDEARILREANEVSNRAWARLFAERPDIEIPEGFRPLPAATADSGQRVSLHPVGPGPLVA